MGFLDDSSLEEDLWRDIWIEEIDREAQSLEDESDESLEIQDDIDSGLYTREEIMDMHGLDEADLDSFDTSLMDDDF